MKLAFLLYRNWAFSVVERLKEFDITTLIVPDNKWLERDMLPLVDRYTIRKIAPTPSTLDHFKGVDADWFVLMGWSHMIDRKSVEKYKLIGMHPSKLPKYRGGTPLQNQIINGEKESAATIFDITDVVDGGAIYAQVPFSLDGEMSEILARMTDATVQGLKETLPYLGKRVPRKQDESQATNSWRRLPSDSLLTVADFQTSTYAYNKIRMLQSPYPNAFLSLDKVVRLTRAKPIDGASGDFFNALELFEMKSDTIKEGMNIVCNDGSLLRLLDVES